MDIQIVDNATVVEPITLSEAKSYLQIDTDYSTDDSQITLALTSARQRLEKYLNIGLVKRAIEVYWGGHEIELPLSPTVSVASVDKSKEDGTFETLTADKYHIIPLPANRLYVKEASCLGGGTWFYSIFGYAQFTPFYRHGHNNTVYKVAYETGYTTLPVDLKQAILAETSYIFNLKGAPVTDLISPNAAQIASGYSRNNALQW